MEIKEIKELKDTVERAIFGVVQNFEERTGTMIEEIQLEHVQKITNLNFQIVSVKLKVVL